MKWYLVLQARRGKETQCMLLVVDEMAREKEWGRLGGNRRSVSRNDELQVRGSDTDYFLAYDMEPA